jgi:hypothetical protein
MIEKEEFQYLKDKFKVDNFSVHLTKQQGEEVSDPLPLFSSTWLGGGGERNRPLANNLW